MSSISFGDTNAGLQVGVVHGSVNTQLHLAPDQTPSPVSTVPFQRDPDFVSRDTILDQIHKRSVPGSRIVLVGLGGVGKSQLAIEHSYRVRSQLPKTWVFWVHASNAARFEQSIREIGHQIKIPEHRDPKTNILPLIESWLRDAKNGQWLLIIDNFDNDAILRKPLVSDQGGLPHSQANTPTKPLLQFLPQCSHGSIIFTSRNKDLAFKVANAGDIIQVDPMNQFEAIELLKRKLGLLNESSEMIKLAEELEFMPLAIIQAAGYITHRKPRYSVSQYLERLQRSDREVVKLLNHEAGHLYRDWEAKNSILLTWQISFDHIRQERPSAANLISLMSFFDWQGIPDGLLQVGYKSKKGHSESWEDMDQFESESINIPSESEYDDDFEEDVTTLRDYSLISCREDTSLFTMHRLVQLTVRVWLKTQGTAEQWKERFIFNLWQEFPTGQYENWQKCQSLFPHVKSAISQLPKSDDSRQKWATLLYRGAWYASESGNTLDMREMALKSREQRMQLFGEQDEGCLESSSMLAEIYWLEGQWEKAETLEVQVMETRKKKLGDDHPDTLTSMANLAATYWNQGRWEEAENLVVQVMETRKKKFGDDHPSTLTSMVNLAATYWNQGRWEEAETLEVQVIETRKKKLGDDHPSTLTSIANLASTYRNQGRWEKAENLEVQVMETSKKKLGDNHPDTLTSMANLASTYWNQGRWEEAETLEVQVIETRKKKLGDDHPDTLTSIANLAATYWNQGRWEEAENLVVQVMETRKKKFGDDHPSTLISIANLASTYRNQGRWEEAENLEVQVMETRKKKLGDDHPDTLTSMANLAATYWNQGRWEEAETLEVQVMETRKKKLGDDHPDTLSSMANLAFTWKSLARNMEALDLLRKCLSKQVQVIGAHHPDTLSNNDALQKWEMETFNINSSV